MTENTSPVKETHEGKQRNNLILILYFLVVLTITMVIAFKDIWPITFFQDLLLDDKNMYPMKLVFMLTMVSIGAVLFPLYWIIKKIIEKKNTAEALAMPAQGTGTAEKEFTFSYSAGVSTVIIDSMYIQVKMGFTKRLFLASSLRNYYLISKNAYQTLYIAYEDETGKLKKCPLNAEAGDSQMAQLVAELQSRFPDKSLNNLTQAEAFKIMKVMNPAMMAVIILLVIFAIIGVIIYFAM
jgi:hypothetical protein